MASVFQKSREPRERNLVSDRTWPEFVEPVEGGVLQLDNTFNRAWRFRDGSYLLTDGPKFRPGLVGLEGQQLRSVQ